MKDMKLNMDKKILTLFIVLFLSNILLWYYLFTYKSGGFNFDISKINHIFNQGQLFFSTASVLIFFAFITSRLPAVISYGDNSSYEIGYLLIFGLSGLSMACFYTKINKTVNLYPYVSMVNLLAMILLVLIITSRFKSFKALINNEYTRRDQLNCMIIFMILGYLSTMFIIPYDKFDGDIRILTVMTAGLFGGPIIGIPTAIVSIITILYTTGKNSYYYLFSTIICGIIASVIYIWNGRKLLKILPSTILVFLLIGLDMLIIILTTPAKIGFPMVLKIYLPMLFGGLMGTMLFGMIAAENKKDDNTEFDAKSEIKELKTSLKKYEDEIKQLKEEVEKK
ncbi:LytS/YhcK type 5TM receptor domain-containing protein [Methanobrevibacter sp.]